MAGRHRLFTLLVLFFAAWSCGKAAAQNEGALAGRPPPAHNRQAKKHVPKLRRACPPDDARCKALREHTCDPYYSNLTLPSDQCTFVQYNKHCAEDVHHIAYLPLFYCRHGDGRVLIALFFLFWMAVLFWVMSKAAEDFLVPALEHLAQLMRMTPDVAGVTLFAFASGAPDLFTQIAAVAGGRSVDQELAISATLGGGLFIIAVIFSVVVLVSKPPGSAGEDGSSTGVKEITDRRAFVRDSVAYLAATLALLGVMLRGVFSAWEAGLLLLGYVAYLAICILTSRGGVVRQSVHGRHTYAAVSPTQQQQQQQNGLAPSPRVQLEMQQLGAAAYAGGSFDNPVRLGATSAFDDVSPRLAQAELVSRSTGSLHQLWRKSPELPSSGGKLQQQGGLEEEAGNELAVLVAGMQMSDGAAANGSSSNFLRGDATSSPVGGSLPRAASRAAWRAKLGGSSTTRLGKALNSVLLGLQEMLHTKGKSGPAMWLTMAMAPAMLLLHATMPALHAGYYTPLYALTLSLGAPLFMLLSTELYPRHLSADHFVLTWLLAALVLLALMLLAVQPAGAASSGSSSGGGPGIVGMQPGTPSGAAVTVVAVAGGSPLAPAPPGSSSPLAAAAAAANCSWWSRACAALTGCTGSRVRHLCGARRPRRNLMLAVLASVQCMLWLSVAADELVSLFQAIGRICDFSQDLLGATVLAWGEAVPELVATMSLARQGQATTAIAAVFGGPCFNILCAWAGPTFYSALRKKAHKPYEVSGGEATLVFFTAAILVFMLAALPLVFRWRLARNAAIAILSIYAVSQITFLLLEGL